MVSGMIVKETEIDHKMPPPARNKKKVAKKEFNGQIIIHAEPCKRPLWHLKCHKLIADSRDKMHRQARRLLRTQLADCSDGMWSLFGVLFERMHKICIQQWCNFNSVRVCDIYYILQKKKNTRKK